VIEEKLWWSGAEEGNYCEGDVECDIEEDDKDDGLGGEALESACCEAGGEYRPKHLSVECIKSVEPLGILGLEALIAVPVT
jgi:hypothetical protein